MTGKILSVNKEKGYGFISSKEKPFTRIFFHWTSLKPSTLEFLELEKGMQVEFELVNYPETGWRAFQVNVTDKFIDEAEAEELSTGDE